MQDAAQYGAVELSSPPSPPKRFGRKLVVALAALGLAGVAALSLGPQKKTATGLRGEIHRRVQGQIRLWGVGLVLPVYVRRQPEQL